MVVDWQHLHRTRLCAIRRWQLQTLATLTPACPTLLYPFSGPDCLHALLFYPNAQRYLLIGQEGISALPDCLTLSQSEISTFTQRVRTAFSDLFARGYFITTQMRSDLEIAEGIDVTALLLVLLVRSQHHIIEVETADADQCYHPMTSVEPASGVVDCLRIRFQKRGSKQRKELIYLNLGLRNDQLVQQPAWLAYLRSLGAVNTFMKSASFALHRSEFSVIRSLVRDLSSSIFQDDSGLPYRHFDKDEWGFHLFGDYIPPIKSFSRHAYQPDLQRAFDKAAINGRRHLPFSLGYHYLDGQQQNHLLAIRRGELHTLGYATANPTSIIEFKVVPA